MNGRWQLTRHPPRGRETDGLTSAQLVASRHERTVEIDEFSPAVFFLSWAAPARFAPYTIWAAVSAAQLLFPLCRQEVKRTGMGLGVVGGPRGQARVFGNPPSSLALTCPTWRPYERRQRTGTDSRREADSRDSSNQATVDGCPSVVAMEHLRLPTRWGRISRSRVALLSVGDSQGSQPGPRRLTNRRPSLSYWPLNPARVF